MWLIIVVLVMFFFPWILPLIVILVGLAKLSDLLLLPRAAKVTAATAPPTWTSEFEPAWVVVFIVLVAIFGGIILLNTLA